MGNTEHTKLYHATEWECLINSTCKPPQNTIIKAARFWPKNLGAAFNSYISSSIPITIIIKAPETNGSCSIKSLLNMKYVNEKT